MPFTESPNHKWVTAVLEGSANQSTLIRTSLSLANPGFTSISSGTSGSRNAYEDPNRSQDKTTSSSSSAALGDPEPPPYIDYHLFNTLSTIARPYLDGQNHKNFDDLISTRGQYYKAHERFLEAYNGLVDTYSLAHIMHDRKIALEKKLEELERKDRIGNGREPVKDLGKAAEQDEHVGVVAAESNHERKMQELSWPSPKEIAFEMDLTNYPPSTADIPTHPQPPAIILGTDAIEPTEYLLKGSLAQRRLGRSLPPDSIKENHAEVTESPNTKNTDITQPVFTADPQSIPNTELEKLRQELVEHEKVLFENTRRMLRRIAAVERTKEKREQITRCLSAKKMEFLTGEAKVLVFLGKEEFRRCQKQA
ncbi:hypothetical protein MMC25_002754 [Agyrium rufum]|nr:hypothetical protein [Agyrium rufum]